MTTGALILATSVSAKQKQFDPKRVFGGISAVQRLILTFRRAKIDYIVLVMDEGDTALEKHVAKLGAICLGVCAEKNTEMLDSVKEGLIYLQGNCDKVFITPADTPLFTVETVTRLLQSSQMVANPVFEKRRGHPLLLDKKAISFVLHYEGKGGLRAAIAASQFPREDIPVGDSGVLLDLEETEEYAQVLRRHSLQKIHPEIKLRLAKEEVFFGPGTRQFLSLIALTGSVRSASGQMGISYSKAWKMLARIEQQLGYSVVERQQGGKNGGQASLTPQGKELLERFEAFEKAVKQATDELFLQYFPQNKQI